MKAFEFTLLTLSFPTAGCTVMPPPNSHKPASQQQAVARTCRKNFGAVRRLLRISQDSTTSSGSCLSKFSMLKEFPSAVDNGGGEAKCSEMLRIEGWKSRLKPFWGNRRTARPKLPVKIISCGAKMIATNGSGLRPRNFVLGLTLSQRWAGPA